MDLEFHKKSLTYLHSIARRAQTQEQTQEIRLPEGMPDIGNVVASWAQVILRGKEWRGDRVGVNGGVMTWVMYLPEEENTPQSVAAWIPFQMKWDIPQTRHDGTIMAIPFLQSVDARSLSARKIMVRSTFGVQMEAMVPEEAAMYVPGDLPEDVKILQKEYPLCLPAEAGEKPFSLEECYTVPANQPKPAQIIRYEMQPVISEWKLMADKVVFRGSAHIHALYRCEIGQLHTWHQEIPFSQFGELDQEYDDSCALRLNCVVTNLELDLTEDSQLCLKGSMSAQFVIFRETMVPLVEDAYSPLRQVTPQMEELSVPAVLDRRQQQVSVEQTVEADAARVLDLAFYPDAPQQIREREGMQIQIPGFFRLLYADPDGAYQSTDAYWEENLPLSMDQDAVASSDVTAMGMPVTGLSSNGVSMQAQMQADTYITPGQGIPMVMGLDLGEAAQKDPNRPSLILRRAGENTVWDIAKQTGTTMEAIRDFCK